MALNLPAPVRTDLFDALRPVRATGLAVRWVEADALHVTLAFLGQLEDARVSAACSAVRAAATRHEPFHVDVTGVGVFPNWRAPRVFWLAVQPTTPVASLHRDVEACLAMAGFAAEERAFTPHVTIGRVKGGRVTVGKEEIERMIPGCGARCEITSVDVMSSRTLPSGPRYERMEAAPLGRPQG